MIKFFRKIREDLISGNKASKYLLYAFGEIVLVVIGILIAINVNNWNEQRINHKKLEGHLAEMLSDLSLDINQLDLEINRASIIIGRNQSFLEARNFDAFSIDSLEKSIETYSVTIRFNKSTFEKIESLGLTDSQKYDSILARIDDYYSYKIPLVQSYFEIINNAVAEGDQVWRYQQSEYEFRYGTENTSIQEDEVARQKLIALLQTPTPRNILKIDIRRRRYQTRLMEGLRYESEALIELIQKELN